MAPPVVAPGLAIQVIERMMSLLEALSKKSESVSLKDLSQITGLHPSTAHRILNDLVLARMVDRTEPGSYQLGMRLLEMGNLVKARLNVRDAAAGPMRELHRLTGETINLSVRQGDEIVYVERTVSERSGMQVVRAIGGRAPLHLTSTGKMRCVLTACAQALRATRATASPTCQNLSTSWMMCGGLALHETMKSLSWVCAVLPRAFTMMRAIWWADYQSRRPLIAPTMAGFRP